MHNRYAYLTTGALMLGLAGCGDTATLPVEAGYSSFSNLCFWF